MRLFILPSLFFLLTSSSIAEPENQHQKLQEWASQGNWDKLAQAEWPEDDALGQLLIQVARREKENWKALLEAPALTHALFLEYDQYLRVLAAYQLEDYERVLSQEVGPQLPQALREDVDFHQAQALRHQEDWPRAKARFRQFLRDHPRRSRRTQTELELASIEWKLENKYEALQLYRGIYTRDISSQASAAEDQLRKLGAFESLSLDVHLDRAERLRRAALFEQGVRELTQLRRQVEPDDQARIDLALAHFEFARRHYQRSESIARQALQNDELTDRLRMEWHQLLAFSMVRQGKYDLARTEYDVILEGDLNSRERQVILFRLGLMALDDKDFSQAVTRFRTLRESFPRGIYQESSHWFESWAIFQLAWRESQKEEPELNKPEIRRAIQLLDRLPQLPEGRRLSAQALYWQSQLEALLGQERQVERRRNTLQTRWAASFHSLLSQEHPMDFARYQPHFVNPKLVETEEPSFRVADPAFQQLSWRRLEAFAGVKLYRWAQLELQNFLSQTGSKNVGLQRAVARRLKALGDWGDLIRYAQINFGFDLENMKTDDPISSFFYPQAYHTYVLEAAKEFKVSPFLIWGVMREESRFQSDVVSPAGAVGLMQLMPSLASQISRQLREGRIDRMGLTDARRNVRYGTQHLKDLIQQVERLQVPSEFHIPLVVAAYNAGIGPVRRWVQEVGTERLDVFIESIPFTETRNYVKRVLQSAHIYHLLYGERVRGLAESEKGTDI